MDLLTKLLTSQKFLVLLASIIGLLITKIFKVQVEQATIMEFVVLISGWMIGQGIAGIGTRAEKVKAIAAVQTDQHISPAEKIDALKSV